ncbi:dTDP-4-dehydrorhamnose reductase [Phycisphaera mikurensis]|uniref:dTDP-4-dehydrorhamnose reductase n=1 Tax=Phycisphaera mikurensis (strain NBRC 102666 / KCTC 22515 / FYK2301M01) TaxID=1142394 RepID=I0IBE1_PHYMF|nr:dTDP-4-dehydrorhamnose reductase [Phycisphaera mikurensis]MBB6442888.1 dTDP-4-dehydrorhamnose reductase [Phycisphaera mikurensis]BAM02579.1 dTDP-4-dehydrorhamnose reductase [Phycisphaera mikurensis NBRC 102666]
MTAEPDDFAEATGRVGVAGVTGLLGAELAAEVRRRGGVPVPLARPAWDFARPDGFPALPAGLRAVVNAAAYTRVDEAEAEEELATTVNGRAVGALARRCGDAGVRLVHVSTDYVFDGRRDTPYPVDHPLNPRSAYGRSKAAGEAALAASGAASLCVRTGWLHGPGGRCFVRTIRDALPRRPKLHVVADQRGRPTGAASLARLLLDLLGAGARGTFHGTDGGEATWFGVARAVAGRYGRGADVLPAETREFARPARRPAYSVLDLAATEALLGPRPPWTVALADTLDRLDAAGPPPAAR